MTVDLTYEEIITIQLALKLFQEKSTKEFSGHALLESANEKLREARHQ